ncbi:MAG: Asp-tRNA(Asn)/Glu-tRNA(Gln) amidotransferase subunit GatC [Chthoniobacterales bacterium]
MPNSDLDVSQIARLARINLTEEEATLFQEQLEQVINFAKKLSEVDVSAVEVSAHASPIFDIFRDDAAAPSFTQEEALQNAPQQAKGLFIVPKVVE